MTNIICYELLKISLNFRFFSDGTAVDPDADVGENVHVYIDKHNGEKFSVVLGLTDIISQKNSYYKLQLLKKDSSNR